MDHTAEVLRCSLVRRGSRLGIMASQDLWAVPLSLGDHADIESGIEKFRRGELAKSED
jgi:hypothetical protein